MGGCGGVEVGHLGPPSRSQVVKWLTSRGLPEGATSLALRFPSLIGQLLPPPRHVSRKSRLRSRLLGECEGMRNHGSRVTPPLPPPPAQPLPRGSPQPTAPPRERGWGGWGGGRLGSARGGEIPPGRNVSSRTAPSTTSSLPPPPAPRTMPHSSRRRRVVGGVPKVCGQLCEKVRDPASRYGAPSAVKVFP